MPILYNKPPQREEFEILSRPDASCGDMNTKIRWDCSFQSPVEIPGVSNTEFLRLAANTRRKAKGEAELDPMEFFGFIVPKVSISSETFL